MKKYHNTYVWFTSLNRSAIDSIESKYDSEVFFKDPFNEIHGVEGVRKLYLDMFDHLQEPHFIFQEILESDDQVFVVWDFLFKIKGKKLCIHGSSHLKFNQKGLIFYHRDYWDVGEELLLKIPLLKIFYGFLKRRFSSL